MKALLAATAVAVGLAAAAAVFAPASRAPAAPAYEIEVRDIAGAWGLVVTPEVVVTVPAHLVMPEVVVCPRPAPDLAALVRAGVEPLN
jgi:hypothetical protein